MRELRRQVAKMENHDLRPMGVHSWILTFDATNVPLDGSFERVCRLAGQR